MKQSVNNILKGMNPHSHKVYMDRVKRIRYLSPMRAAKVQASLRIRAVSPEPPLLAHTSSESRGTFRQKARSLAPLNGWACAVKICNDGMLDDTNSLDGAQLLNRKCVVCCCCNTLAKSTVRCLKLISPTVCYNVGTQNHKFNLGFPELT